MSNISSLEKIEIVEAGGRLAIRLDWSNDRHQMVPLLDTSADCVISALERIAFLIAADKHSGNLT